MSRATKICDCCGIEFERRYGLSAREWAVRRYCSAKCVRERLPIKRVIAGDYIVHKDGYIRLYVPMHPSSDGTYVYLHRLIMERKIGRLLRSDEIVHHINEDPTDNRPENLEITDLAEHRRIHARFSDTEIAQMVLAGLRAREINRLGANTHAVARVRKQLRAQGLLA